MFKKFLMTLCTDAYRKTNNLQARQRHMGETDMQEHIVNTWWCDISDRLKGMQCRSGLKSHINSTYKAHSTVLKAVNQNILGSVDFLLV